MANKTTHDVYYHVINKKDTSGLRTVGETVEELKADIDRSNERAVRLGYKAEQWAIVQTEFWHTTDEDGYFISKESKTTVVTWYPENME